jgi:endonuclease G
MNRPARIAGIAALGAAVGFGAGALYERRRRAAPPPPPAAPPLLAADLAAAAAHPAARHGLPRADALLAREGYVASYDTRLRNARWVVERVTRAGLAGRDGDRANSAFAEDGALPARFRAALADFRGSGFDRGHLAPAANHKGDQAAMDATFSLSNVSPQVGDGFNRSYWARLERFVQELAGTCDAVFVATGPLFLPRAAPAAPGGAFGVDYGAIGAPPRLVAVPTHFFKVVLAERGGAAAVAGAFVVPNAAVDARTPLAEWVVPLSALEEVAGVAFFPEFFTDARRRAVDEAAAAVRARAGAGRRPLLPVGATAVAPLALPAPRAAAAPAAPLLAPSATDVVHVCDHRACVLPAERWWEAGKKAKEAKAAAALRRSASSPAL